MITLKMPRLTLQCFCTATVAIVYCILVLPLTVKAQNVEFTVSNNVAYVGQPVTFQCASNTFDPEVDKVTFSSQRVVLVQFHDGDFTYSEGRSDIYTTKIVTIGETKMGLALTISQVSLDDMGNYICSIIKQTSGRSDTSSSVRLVVQYFTSPTCLGPQENANISYLASSGELMTKLETRITLICNIEEEDINMMSIVEWYRSDGKTVMQSNIIGFQTLSFISSPDDHCVDFKCRSSNPVYEGISYGCTISVFTLDRTEHVCPSHSVPTTEAERNTSTPATATPVAVDELPLPLIIGASWAVCILILVFIGITICICVARSSKRAKKRISNIHLITQRPSQDINNLPRFSIDSFDSDIDISPVQNRKSRTNYENTDPALHNIDEEPDQGHSMPPIDPSKSRLGYENSKNGRFVLPPIQTNAKDSHFVLQPLKDGNDAIYDKTPDDINGVRNFVAEKDAEASEVNNRNLANDNDNSIPSPTPGGDSATDHPVYAGVKKNTLMSVSSVNSDEDNTIPTYALVNRDLASVNKDRASVKKDRASANKDSERESRLLAQYYAYTEEPDKKKEESIEPYAEMEFY